jgi:hypothetical protein
MNEEELADLISNHFPNLYTDWAPPPPLQSIPPSAHFTYNNNTKTMEEFTFEFRGKIRAHLSQSAQSLNVNFTLTRLRVVNS